MLFDLIFQSCLKYRHIPGSRNMRDPDFRVSSNFKVPIHIPKSNNFSFQTFDSRLPRGHFNSGTKCYIQSRLPRNHFNSGTKNYIQSRLPRLNYYSVVPIEEIYQYHYPESYYGPIHLASVSENSFFLENEALG